MTVKVTKPALNLREKLSELDKPSGIAGQDILKADTPQEVFNYIGAGRRNLVINGNFLIWQRGTNITTSTGYTYGADRWSDYWGMNYLKQSATINGETVNTCKFTTQASYFYLYHRIEDNLTNAEVSASFYKGKTVSFWYKTNVSSGYEAGIFSGLDQVTVNADEQWHYHTYTHTSTPSNNKFIGIGGATSGTSYIELANVQIEYGSVATPFEHRSYGEELALCQRYYQRLEVTSSAERYMVGSGHYNSSTILVIPFHFVTTMRTAPSLAKADVSYFDIEPWDVAPSSFYMEQGATHGCWLSVTDPASRTTGYAGTLFADTVGAYLAFDAEL